MAELDAQRQRRKFVNLLMSFRFPNLSLPILMLSLLPLSAEVPQAAFLKANCTDCHDAEEKKGGLDLTSLDWKLTDPVNFEKWVKVYDQVQKR